MKILNNRKVLGTILGTVFFICCLMYFTYAYYVWRSDNTIFSFFIEDEVGEFACYMGPDVNVENIGPVLDFVKDGVKVDFNVSNTTDSANIISVILNITSITSNLQNQTFKYKLFKDVDMGNGVVYDYDAPVVEGNFKNLEEGDNTIASNISVGAGGNYNFQFIVYIDGNVYNDPDMQDGKLVSSLSVGNCDVGEYYGANSPNLDDGNLIPVYYDETATDTSNNSVGAWRKADSYNKNNSWYDYDNKKWANAVLIKNSTKRSTYKSADVDTLIPVDDIDAFLVWIPRFKYRVWNISRQMGDETTYAYNAYTNGIDIIFEKSTFNTGNVECTYDVTSEEALDNLSDKCIYNNTDIITTESVNSNYTDAWYTHPAFTFGDEEKTGFWIGKFETTGSSSIPTIKPDLVSLSNQNVSNQFTTSKVFQTYGLSSLVDVHMLTNLEWGAVAYLTHSIYGLCSEGSCRDAYINNSSSYYTGRSAGVLAVSSTYSTYGTYDYRGYSLDSSGEISSEKALSKVSSTTGNVTGVYDMSGGAAEYVTGNMVDSNSAFYPSGSGTIWNGNAILNKKYYNAYSYGTSYYDSNAYNRSRLGDATGEVTASNSSYPNRKAWSPGTDVVGSFARFVSTFDEKVWFERGGSYQFVMSGLFHFNAFAGGVNSSDDIFSFRLSIS